MRYLSCVLLTDVDFLKKVVYLSNIMGGGITLESLVVNKVV